MAVLAILTTTVLTKKPIIGSLIVLILAFACVWFLSYRDAEFKKSSAQTKAVGKKVDSPVHSVQTQSRKSSDSNFNVGSVELLSAFIRIHRQNGTCEELYSKIIALNLPSQMWWNNAREFDDLRGLAEDQTVDDCARLAALQLYVAAIPKRKLEKQSEHLQATFAEESDVIVGGLVQSMAEVGVPPMELIYGILTDLDREQNTRSLAWYASRLTAPASEPLVKIAMQEAEGDASLSSKAAADYLASAAHADIFKKDSALQASLARVVEKAASLPEIAGIMEKANADAFVSAIPNMVSASQATETLLELLEHSTNSEVKISALDQLVALHLSGKADVLRELDEVRKNLDLLFPDGATRVRAGVRLGRL